MTTFINKLASTFTVLALVASFSPMAAVAAPGDTVPPSAPSAVFPADNQTLPSADLTMIQWSDAADAASYTYEVSFTDTADGDFVNAVYTQSGITASELATGPNPDGVYYWHVKTKDEENLESAWSETFMFTLAPATTANVDSEAELAAALDDTNITTITLDDSFSVNATVDVDRAVTINGNGKTITAAPGVTGSGVLVTGSGAVRINNLTVNGGGNYIQGIQAYVASDVELSSVTSMNNGKSGIMINGSTVKVTDVSTSGNTWHGINVDQGSGVTSAAALTVEGTSTHSEAGPDIYVDNTTKTVSVSGAVAQYALVHPTATSDAYFLNSATVSNEAELTAALADTYVATITLDDSFDVSATVQVNRAVTIDGSDETITAGGAISHVVLITASNVLIKDLTVDGDNNMVHGVQAYVVTGITLDKITSINNGKSGILVNGSTVAVTDVTTSGNGWHAINVDQGSGVTTVAALTINGTSAHAETVPAIWVDNKAKNVSVTDTDAQYTATDVTYTSGASTVTGTQYFLTPDPVVEDDDDNNGGGSGRSGSGRRNVNTNSNANDNASVTGQVNSTTPGQGQVLGASTYNFTVDLSYGSTGPDVVALQQMLIDAGLLKIAAPTGWFGPMTRAALAQWQAAHGVAPAVGYFGPITRAAILAANAASAPAAAE